MQAGKMLSVSFTPAQQSPN